MYSAEASVCIPVILLVFLFGVCSLIKTFTVVEKQSVSYEEQYEAEDISKAEILRIAEAISETFTGE